jgi:hypothetical protein
MRKTFAQTLVILMTSLSALTLTSACLNTSSNKTSLKKSSSTGTTGAGNLIINYGTFTIASIAVGSAAESSTTGLPVTVTFNLANSTSSMLDSCTSNTGSNPCLCKFSWNEINSASGNSITIAHKVFTPVTAVQRAAISCTTPLTWQTEIPDNTSVTISIVPAQGNTGQFTVTPYGYTKGQHTETATFTDSMGRSFVNVLRYSCYEQRQRGLTVMNKIGTQSVTSIGSFNYVMASQFCLRDYKGEAKGGSGCETLPPADYSSQSYYFNMYIRDSESGDVNPGNAVFVCPKVTEALNQQRDGSGNPIPGTQGKFWPMDSSFALSLGKTSDFSVGIVAHTKTTNVNDPTAQNTSCEGTSSSPSSANSLISSCLGFAAKPNLNGTCPKLTLNKPAAGCPSGTIANGTSCTLPTYRLRRFVSTYPPIYDTDGNIIPESQRIDTVYVLDRPVLDGSGNILMDSSGSPYSMLGPKPCPFSFFDNYNVTGAGYGYFGTNNSLWDNKNVDNIYFPYQDTGAGGTGTCSALLPSNDVSLSKVTLTTLTTKKYIRPISSWAPHYEEDTGFQACAPQSTPLRDPPLHFAMKGSKMAWCAEVYPSQNDNAARLPAGANNYTSHTMHNVTLAGVSCSTTAVAGHAGNNGTCDRTVVNPGIGIAWPKFPLLAPEADVTKALQTDASFGCTMTYDSTGGKTNSADFTLGSTPSQGCCSNVAPPAGAGNSAHLEPTPAPTSTPAVYSLSCQPPRY